jgi:regulator of sigma E protease
LEPFTLIAFLLILSLLVFVHELGHFIVAKRAGITVEEFAIGFPPRAIKLWQEEGSITLDGHEFVIGRKTNVPRTIQPGAKVYAETTIDEQGRPVVTKLELIRPVEDKKEQEAKPNSFLSRLVPPLPSPPKPEPIDERPTVIVDALTRPTEYAINLIPFGGYVRMLGEEDPSAPGSFASKSKKARFAVLIAGSVMNLIIAIILLTLTFMAGIEGPITGINADGKKTAIAKTLITEVVANSPAEKAGLQMGDVIVRVDDVEIEYEGDLTSYIDKTKGTEVTLYLERNGSLVTTSLVPRANPPEGQGAMGIVIKYVPAARVVITEVLPDTPADKAGLKAGDIIIGADDVEFKYVDDLTNYLEKTKDSQINLHVKRDNEFVTASLISSPVDLFEGQDVMGARVKYSGEITYYPVYTALIKSVSLTGLYMTIPFYLPIAILRNDVPTEAARPTGPVGIFRQTASSVNDSTFGGRWSPILGWMAILSAALAITNLLPLPALDGGRILFVIVEAIRGKRVAPEKEGAIHFIGLVLLLTTMLVITYYDIIDPIPTMSLF